MLLRRILLFAFLLVGVRVAVGQATATGTLTGVVTDSTGAALPHVAVTATETGTNARRTTTTSPTGEYRFDLLPAGQYVVHIDAPGFSPSDTPPMALQVGSSLTANVPLKTGTVATVVEVETTNSALLDTEKTDSSTNVTTQQIQDLPMNGRDFANLAILAPGVKLVDSYDPTKNRYAIYAVNGSSGRNTNTTVNGCGQQGQHGRRRCDAASA